MQRSISPYAMDTYREVEVWPHSFLTLTLDGSGWIWGYGQTHLNTRWKWVVRFTSWSLYPLGKKPWYLLNGRLGGPHTGSGCNSEDTNLLPQLVTQPRHSVEPVAWLVYQMCCPGSYSNYCIISFR